MVIVTHNPSLAARYASRTITMADGRINSRLAAVEAGTALEGVAR
jgi:ABC-type cobalamin/Fe3+-siderophores transport system ATPase subunit